jgi:hypothetical protein
MAASANQRGNAAAVSSSSVETDCGLDKEDSNPSPVVTSSALIGSDPDEEVVQEEATSESGLVVAARTNQRGEATAGSCSSVEEDGGSHDEEDLKPSLVTSSAPTGSCPNQEVVQEEATTPGEILSGWKRVKLEPDC